MYTRKIRTPRASPVENGIPLTGTWNKAFTHVDLSDIRRPYLLPLPRWLKYARVKEWESIAVQNINFYLVAVLGNFKIFQTIQIFLHDKEKELNYHYKKFYLGNNWRLPKTLYNSSVEYRSSRFFFRIHPWLMADTIKLDIDIKKTNHLPALTVQLAFCMNSHDVTPMAVSLSFSKQRNMYAYKALTRVRGDIVLGEKHSNLKKSNCIGLFCDYKGFYPYRMKGVFCSGMGFDGKGRHFGFHMAENQTKETKKVNENAFWLEGSVTPLPSIKITMPNGPESDWIIQDVEGMVDLTFTPKVTNWYGINFLIISGDLFAPMGYYNGMLVSSGGEKIKVHNLWGTGEKLYLRV